MKTTTQRFTLLACGLALVAMPAAFAGSSADKFKLLDANGDGRVSQAEHAAGAHQMFVQADANGDGIVTAAELAVKHDSKADSTAQETSSTRGNPNAAVQEANEKIKLIDTDGDGKISLAESEAGSKAMFAKMDTDGDGYLSASECEAGHQSIK
jgi:hypothetical protein